MQPASSELFSAADFTQMARWCRLFPCMSLVRQAGVSSLISRYDNTEPLFSIIFLGVGGGK